ncbi:MAG: PAS domain S-box protein [Candidatus Methanoperedens sp.]|nr:PAS domain S-box protein [Candidatus Methanoperedens sp.]
MFWGRLTVSLVRDPEDKPEFAIGMIEDITERKEAERRKSPEGIRIQRSP